MTQKLSVPFALTLLVTGATACQTAPAPVTSTPKTPPKAATPAAGVKPITPALNNATLNNTAASRASKTLPSLGRIAFPDTLAATFFTIETAFANNNCTGVLENWRPLGLPETEARFANLPHGVAIAVSLCKTQVAPLDNTTRRLAVSVLSKAEESNIPFFDKSWFAKTLATQHAALGEFDLATAAAQREKEHLAKQSARFATMGGLAPASSATNGANPANASPLTTETLVGAEKVLADAKNAMNAGDPSTAIALLDSLSDGDKNEKSRRLRRDAVEAHVKDLRTRARQQYLRAQSAQSQEIKIEALQQSKEISEQILAKYPDTPSRPGIERSLNSITSEIEFLRKK
jgi:hypothetical protein